MTPGMDKLVSTEFEINIILLFYMFYGEGLYK